MRCAKVKTEALGGSIFSSQTSLKAEKEWNKQVFVTFDVVTMDAAHLTELGPQHFEQRVCLLNISVLST